MRLTVLPVARRSQTQHFTFFSQRFQITFIATLFTLAAHLLCISAQVLVNGQTFTNGLSIVDAPAPSSQFHAGSNITIAIEVSGNGKLPPAASIPGSGLSTRFDELDIFLVSSQTNLNLTVSTGPGLLTEESGSVRHFDWPIPSCIPPGQYNLTFYESFHFNNEAHLSITPIPLSIDNNSPSGICSQGINPLEAQPQASADLDSSPFLPTNGQQASITTGFPDGSPIPSGMETSFVGNTSPTAANVITITLSADGGLPFDFPPTVTVSPMASPTTLTMVVVSMATVTTTEPGKDQGVTKTVTSSWTTTATSNDPGFVPVNASQTLTMFSLPWILGLWAFLLILRCI